jgi:hypothetical protein
MRTHGRPGLSTGYYGRLFREHPYRERAGLAGMIGPALHGPDQIYADRPGSPPGARLPPGIRDRRFWFVMRNGPGHSGAGGQVDAACGLVARHTMRRRRDGRHVRLQGDHPV